MCIKEYFELVVYADEKTWMGHFWGKINTKALYLKNPASGIPDGSTCLQNANKPSQIQTYGWSIWLDLQALAIDPAECRFSGQIKGDLLVYSINTNAFANLWMAMFVPPNLYEGFKFAASAKRVEPTFFWERPPKVYARLPVCLIFCGESKLKVKMTK